MRLTFLLCAALLVACFDPPLEAVLVDRRTDLVEMSPEMSTPPDVAPDLPELSPCPREGCVLWAHAHPNRWARVVIGSGEPPELFELTLGGPGVVVSFVMTGAYVFALMDEGGLWRCDREGGTCISMLDEMEVPRALIASSAVASGVLALRANGTIVEIVDAEPGRLLFGTEILRVPAPLAAQATAAAFDRATGRAWLLLPAGETRALDVIARVEGRVTFLETGTTGTTGLVATSPDLLWTAWRQDDVQSRDGTTGLPLDIELIPEIGPIAALAGGSSSSP